VLRTNLVPHLQRRDLGHSFQMRATHGFGQLIEMVLQDAPEVEKM
jgi:hypothetical protein